MLMFVSIYGPVAWLSIALVGHYAGRPTRKERLAILMHKSLQACAEARRRTQ